MLWRNNKTINKESIRMKKRYFVITLLCILISMFFGVISNDIVIGGTILLTGLLNAYYASEGKRSNYIFGLINYLLMGFVALKNHLYGIFFFYIFIFSPLQVGGLITWKKNLNENKSVKIKGFTLNNSIIITLSCILGSIVLGYLLTLIPNQRLAFMDASSNCINLCSVVLMLLRFKESWWLWIFSNLMDLSIWIITFIDKGENSTMMLLSSISYLLINIYGILK